MFNQNNHVHLIGNLGKDPQIKRDENGIKVKFSLATNASYKNRETGEWVEDTDWHQVHIFGKYGERAFEYLRKGSSVIISGTLKTHQYDDNGTTRYYTYVKCLYFREITYVSHSSGNTWPDPNSAPPPDPPSAAPEETAHITAGVDPTISSDEIDDDLPF